MIPATTQLRADSSRHHVAHLVALFNDTFMQSQNTLLLPNVDAWRNDWRGDNAHEPLYLPADAECPHHRIVFAHGFFASALHEIAHWCLAGARRRALVDYGYWYAPDDRDVRMQAKFEHVEARPQAIECAFSRAAGFPFGVSADNLSGIEVDRAAFERKVRDALHRFETRGFPPRAQQFIAALSLFYASDARAAHAG